MLKSISKLFISNRIQSTSYGFRQISTQKYPLQFKASSVLWAEPLKKKKKIDPSIIKAREERKKKRIMKEIRKLQKKTKELKPIADLEIPACLEEEEERRRRIINLPEEVVEERILLLKQWTAERLREGYADTLIINKLVNSQRKALEELRLESEELYQAAVKIDENLIPFKFSGPPETPPNKDYPTPDGAYIDVSKKDSPLHFHFLKREQQLCAVLI